MYIYRKSYPFLSVLALVLILINVIFIFTEYTGSAFYIIPVVSVIFFVLISLFFRVPVRKYKGGDNIILSPADGTVVAVEETSEDEYLKTECVKVSIFMSLFNVHQNIVPVSGEVKYFKHHQGKYIVAWHPKSSIKNEHTSLVIDNDKAGPIKISQIAGFVARRIVCNLREGDVARQGDELGFIFFGSRVDLYLPSGVTVKIKPGDKVRAKIDVIADIPGDGSDAFIRG